MVQGDFPCLSTISPQGSLPLPDRPLVGAKIAENERTHIKQRQTEGIAAAKAKGVKFGRPPKPLPENFHSCYQRWKKGEITGTAAAKECGMPLSTFLYRAEAYKKSDLL